MSLYEQFHSEINKTFMFDIIKGEINKNLTFDISTISENYEDFLRFFKVIFDENDVDDIESLNKILLDQSIVYFTEKIRPTNDLEKLLKQRDQMLSTINEIDDTSIDNTLMDDLTNTSSSGLTNTSISGLTNTSISEVTPYLMNKEPSGKLQEPTGSTNQVEYKTSTIVSSKRTNINSSRFNYRIDLAKCLIDSLNITKISKMILPLEENYIFDIPVISVSIPELDCKVHMQQQHVIENKNQRCGVYYPVTEHLIKSTKIDKITIDIRDITDTKYPIDDILKINIIEIKGNSIVFTCSNIHKNNFKVGNNIKVLNIHSNDELQSILQLPFKIKKIDKNLITCKTSEQFKSETYNNIDMKLMNMSNQNIIYFT
jgi:hypothetical protein